MLITFPIVLPFITNVEQDPLTALTALITEKSVEFLWVIVMIVLDMFIMGQEDLE
jgi:hypothetical protein